jgi:hypothetical protein
MKMANANCRTIPHITVRHGINLRFDEIAHVQKRIATIPNALINCNGMA